MVAPFPGGLPPSLMQPPPPGLDPLQNPDLIAFMAQAGIGGPPMPPDPMAMMGGGPPMGPDPAMGMGGPPPMDPMMGMAPPPMPPMPPEMMMGPSGPPPVDPLAFLDEPVPDDLLGAPERQPTYPPWFHEPPKPTKDELDDLLEILRNRQRGYVDRVRVDIEILRAGIDGKGIGVFFKKDEPFHVTTMVNDWRLAINAVGSIDPFRTVPFSDPALKSETQQVEDFLRKVREDEIRQHARRGHGHVGLDEVEDLTARGRVVCRQVLDLSDPEEPIDRTLLDPTQVYALRTQKRGLEAVFHVYTDTVAGVIGDFDDKDGTLRKKLTTGDGAKKLTDPVLVTDYWDTWWRGVWVDDEVAIALEDHQYGEPPFIITTSGIGGAHATPRNSDELNPGLDIEHDEGKYQDGSFIHYRKRSHQQHEAIMSRFFTELKKTENPAWMRRVDEIGAGKERPTIRTEAGALNEFMMHHEEVMPLTTAPAPNIFGPLLAASDANNATSGLPKSLYGANDQSNVSGYAVENLNDAGLEKFTPVISSMERHHEAKDEQCLRFFRNFGHLVVDPATGEPGGQVTVQRSRPTRTQAPAFVFSPDVLDRTGTRVQVKMTAIKKRNLGAMVNAGMQLVTGGISTKRWLREEIGDPDPDRTRDEVMMEQFADDERVKDVMLLKAAKNSKDPISSALLEEAVQAKRAELMAPPPSPGGGAPPAPGSEPPGGAPPGAFPRPGEFNRLPPPAGTSYPSLGPFGPGPGSGPQAPLGPRGITPYPSAPPSMTPY